MKIIGNGGHAKVVREFAFGEGYVIAIGDNATRKRMSADPELGEPCEALIHPKACVSPLARIGRGTVVMAWAIVQADAVIGNHCILNTGCSVDHDCVVEDFVHLAPGVHLCGGVRVGEGALVGVGSCAPPGRQIESWSLIRAGSVA